MSLPDWLLDPPDREDSQTCPECGGEIPEDGCARCGSTGIVWPSDEADFASPAASRG
jgi:hypothetical protein